MSADQVVLSIDTSDLDIARKLIKLAKDNGGKVVKFGLELSTAYSWRECAELANEHDINWIADAKLDDIPHTVQMAVKNLCKLSPRPLGITVHIKSGDETLRLAQSAAGNTIIFGVTELTAIPEAETWEKYSLDRSQLVNRLFHFAKRADIKGVVVSGKEIEDARKNHLVTLVPGIRSHTANKNDQSNTIAPKAALKQGADYIVIGRQVTEAKNPSEAYKNLLQEMKL